MSREGLQIKKGGKLWRTRWVDKTEGYVEKDVTESAISYLFDHCTLEEGVTLRDIFLLLNTELDIFDTIIGNWCKEIVTEGLTRTKNPEKETEVEYLELYWHFYKDKEYETKKSYFGGNIFPQFHGMGFVHTEDYYEQGVLHCKAGDRINYGVSFTPASELIDLPVKFSDTVCIYNEDDWNDKPQVFEVGEYSLGHILYGIIWELSFHGGPETRDKVADDLFTSVDELKKELNND